MHYPWLALAIAQFTAGVSGLILGEEAAKNAAPIPTGSPIEQYLDNHLTLVQSSSTTSGSALPATILYTDPHNGPAYYAIDAAFGYKESLFKDIDYTNAELDAEVHRDTITTNQSRSYLLSVKVLTDWKWKSIGFWPALNVSYKDDRILNTESSVVSVGVSPELRDWGMGKSRRLWDNAKKPNPFEQTMMKWVSAEWEPTFGLEGEDVVHATKGAHTGHVERGTWGINGYLYPLYQWLDTRFALTTSVLSSYDLDRSPGFTGANYHQLCTAAVSYAFDDKKHLSISASYNDGSNPITGTPDQKYFLLGLKAKY